MNNGEGWILSIWRARKRRFPAAVSSGAFRFCPIPVTDGLRSLADSATWIHGGHTVKFGVDYNRYHTCEIFRGNWRGVYIFNNLKNF